MLGYLARRLADLIDILPVDPAAIDLATAADHVARLSYDIKRATAWMNTALNSAIPVLLPQREAIEQLTDAMIPMADAQQARTRALAHVAHGYRAAAIPGVGPSHLRADESTSRIIAADFYSRARGHLDEATAELRRDPRPAPRISPPPAAPASAPRTGPRR
ncbi:hypothetical protein SAMN05216267_103939 [Actinacidiphila rubida]|uniref:Uncharacterized protein n=2 Tax=Actinacidiphila rubida TaxID=310780 RepID=A0A1H8S530_9ACTN|nr:hypothetical protein [Actinacidiphila rubida]SEO73646.1 hypothetical protein SAMN05216267_103939 [Actinacidiphila rubida]